MAAPFAVDDEEFERLYRQWRREALALCRRLVGRADAEDAVQETFLRAWSARAHYSPSKPFWPWLSTIARRLCVDERRRPTAEPVGLGIERTVVRTTPERVVVASEELRLVIESIDGLRPAERRALVHHEFAGMSYQTIALVEGTTIEAVRSTLKRARASLRS